MNKREFEKNPHRFTYHAVGSVQAVCFSPHGSKLVWAEGREVVVCDVSPAFVKMTLRGHTNIVLCVAYSTDGRVIGSGGLDRTVKLWDADTRGCYKTLRHKREVNGISFSDDGKIIASCSGEFQGDIDNSVRLWCVKSGRQTRILKGHTDGVSSVSFAASGAVIFSSSFDYSIRLWDTATGSCQTLGGHVSDNPKCTCSPSDFRFSAWYQERKSTCLVDGHSSFVESVAFAPCGKRLLSASSDWTLKVWDTTTGSCTFTIQGHSPANPNCTCKWHSPSNPHDVDYAANPTCPVMGHCDSVSSVAFSADGLIASAGGNTHGWGDLSICLWDADTGSCKQIFKSLHESSITSVASSPVEPNAGNHLYIIFLPHKLVDKQRSVSNFC